jgi:hypothetical protein
MELIKFLAPLVITALTILGGIRVWRKNELSPVLNKIIELQNSHILNLRGRVEHAEGHVKEYTKGFQKAIGTIATINSHVSKLNVSLESQSRRIAQVEERVSESVDKVHTVSKATYILVQGIVAKLNREKDQDIDPRAIPTVPPKQ